LLQNVHTENLGPGLLLWCNLNNKKGHEICTWRVGSLYIAGLLTAAARELARYKLDLVGVQEVRWDKGGMARAGDCNFSMERKRISSIIII